MHTTYYSSPLGTLEIQASDDAIVGLNFVEKSGKLDTDKDLPRCLKDCLKQLDDYFSGRRKDFKLPLYLSGTEFQQNVWHILQKIPYGKTLSYSELACQIQNPKACRAVGGANNKNKIAILIPCHRVLGQDGSLTGYAGGVWRKEWLLEHERQNSATLIPVA